MIKTTCSYNRDRTQNKWFSSQESKQKRNKIKIGIFTARFLMQYFGYTTFFRFSNHTLKLKAADQPQSAGKESLLIWDIT